jgi:hypothetical protein
MRLSYASLAAILFASPISAQTVNNDHVTVTHETVATGSRTTVNQNETGGFVENSRNVNGQGVAEHGQFSKDGDNISAGSLEKSGSGNTTENGK